MLRFPGIHTLVRPMFNRFKPIFFVALLAAVLLTCLVFQSSVRAQSAESLATQYAPVFHFTSGENFYPTSVDYIIGSSVVKQRTSYGTETLSTSPSPENLNSFPQNNFFLDNKGGTLESIAADYSSKAESLGYYAYVHTVQSGSSTVIQYWLFYVFNDGPLNQHQGDIEVVQVFLDSAGNPQTLLLSQHGAGENAVWSDVEKEDGHPVVYVAQGSHANFFRSYQGKMGIENDIVGGNGKTINPSQLNLVFLGEQGSHPENQNWLEFPGRWGNVGSEQDVALGQAGPEGPIFNQGGVRWSQPQRYLAQTLAVDGLYFTLAWLVASITIFFVIYILARAAYKTYGIYKVKRSGGIRVGKLLRGVGAIGFAVGMAAIVVTLVALFVPWYTITASSEAGPLAQNSAPLMTIDGVNGLKVNMFTGPANSDSTSGYVSLFSAQMPFALFFAAGIVLLALDIVGMKTCRSFAKNLWIGVIGVVLPIVFIVVFISQLPGFLPFAAGMFPGQDLPPQVIDTVNSVAAAPMAGTSAQIFPVVGATTVTWGLSIGAYLFILAAILRIVGGALMFLVRNPQEPSLPMSNQPYQQSPQGAAPQMQQTQTIARICPNCGRVIEEEVKFCPHCGQKLSQ